MIDPMKLPPDVLDAVRMRFDVEADDDSQDENIAALSPEDIAAEFAGWHLGDSWWGAKIISVYKEAQRAKR